MGTHRTFAAHRVPHVLVPALVLAVAACDTTSRPARPAATATPTPGVRSPLVREAPQPAERIAPDPTPTPMPTPDGR